MAGRWATGWRGRRETLKDVQLTSEGGGDIGEDIATAFERWRLPREQIQIVGHPVAEVKAGERSTAGEEEVALTLKESGEDFPWRAVSLLCAKEATAAPAFNQEGPESIPAADSTPQAIQHACHFCGTYEVPDIDITRFAQHLREELIAPRAIGTGEDLVELVDRDVLVPQEVRPQLPLPHVGRQRPHRKEVYHSTIDRPQRRQLLKRASMAAAAFGHLDGMAQVARPTCLLAEHADNDLGAGRLLERDVPGRACHASWGRSGFRSNRSGRRGEARPVR